MRSSSAAVSGFPHSRGRHATRIVFPVLAVALLFPLTYSLWKPVVKEQRWFIIASNVANDSLRRVGVKTDQIGQDVRVSPPLTQIPGEVARMRKVYGSYLKYAGMTPETVKGKNVLELGPGMTMSIPVLFAADGAAKTVGIDKFVPFQSGSYYKEFYSQLRSGLTPEEQRSFDHAIRVEGPALNAGVTQLIYRKELPEVVQELGPGQWDVIVSNAVMEEMYDPTPNFQAQDKLLRPGGVMVHNIDLRDYGMFSGHGFHPLEFLTVPDWQYRLMVEGSGQADRRLVNYYRDLARHMGYESEIWVRHVLGREAEMPVYKKVLEKDVDYGDAELAGIAKIRPRLRSQFAQLPDSDLLTQSIVFVARKPQ